MRRFWFVLVAIFVLFQVGLGARTALAQSIEITPEVWGSYQQYLGRIGVTNPGAFAISRDGGSSFYFYCSEPRCMSGTTYRHEALRRCEDMAGRECVIFALRDEIQIPYTIEERATTAVTAPSAPLTPEPEEPPFESPLADGTIVLSHQIAADLERYLAAIVGQGVVGFFYVSPNGREAGSFVCDMTGVAGLPLCPLKPSGPWVDPKPDTAEIKAQAGNTCEAAYHGDCVMLYANGAQRASHKLTDNPPPQRTTTSVAPAAAIVAEPEEPPFESPLADGTIVLSRKVARELDSYLAALDRSGVAGFFYVAPDGRNAGAFACDITGTAGVPLCPMKPMPAWSDPKPDPARIKQRARELCQSGNGGECIMLYSADSRRANYKIVD